MCAPIKAGGFRVWLTCSAANDSGEDDLNARACL